jgi:hypothetical protein
MLRSIPRWKKHELMLLWCRTPMGIGLVRKVGSRAFTRVSGAAERAGRILGISKPAPSEAEREAWLSLVVGELIDKNVRSLLIVGATANDGVTDTLVERVRAGGSSIEVVCLNGPPVGIPDVTTAKRGADFAGFDCVVVRNSALFTGIGIDAVSGARMLVVCETDSFDGHQIVTRVLCRSQWELSGSHADVWDGCVVFRRTDDSRSGAGWEILDILHRREGTIEAS